ncbi:MAG: hypothetical protein V5B34_13255 [Accumulibacter sp.]|jgi:hypothetical protein
MKKIAAVLFTLASRLAIAAPGSYSGNIEPDGGGGGNASWWVIIISVIGLPLAFWIFSLVCHEERKEGDKVTWWNSMDHVGKGVTIIGVIFIILFIGNLFS